MFTIGYRNWRCNGKTYIVLMEERETLADKDVYCVRCCRDAKRVCNKVKINHGVSANQLISTSAGVELRKYWKHYRS